MEELLAVLLNDVCSRTRWDIATRGKRLSDVGIVDDPGSKASGPHFDVCTLIRRVQASRVLVNYCMRKGHAEVLQLECAEQQASGLEVTAGKHVLWARSQVNEPGLR